MASASSMPTTTPTAKPATARRSEYHTAPRPTDASTVPPPATPATSCSPNTSTMRERCGIDASSLRGRTSASPMRTPSSGATSL